MTEFAFPGQIWYAICNRRPLRFVRRLFLIANTTVNRYAHSLTSEDHIMKPAIVYSALCQTNSQ